MCGEYWSLNFEEFSQKYSYNYLMLVLSLIIVEKDSE